MQLDQCPFRIGQVARIAQVKDGDHARSKMTAPAELSHPRGVGFVDFFIGLCVMLLLMVCTDFGPIGEFCRSSYGVCSLDTAISATLSHLLCKDRAGIFPGHACAWAWRSLAGGLRRDASVIRAIEEFPHSARQRCLARQMRNLAVKVPTDLWPEFKTRVAACYRAPSRAIARELANGIRSDYATMLRSAVSCFEHDFEPCIAHLGLRTLRRSTRTTNLLGRLLVEERKELDAEYEARTSPRAGHLTRAFPADLHLDRNV